MLKLNKSQNLRWGEFYASDSPSLSRVRGRAADCEHDVDAVGPEPALVASLLHEWPDDLKALQALEVSLQTAVAKVDHQVWLFFLLLVSARF